MLLIYLFVFVIGLCFGSFSNVLIWRVPQGLKITGRSVCRKCKNKISWFDNIPLLSFVLLKARCRNCKTKISLKYPLVELITGIIFVLLFLKFGLSSQMFLFSLFSPLLISIFFIDLDHQIIPDELVFFGMGLSFLYLVFINPPLFYANIFAGFISSFFLLCLHFITKGKGMGLGDVKFAVLGGMLVGLTNIFTWFFIAFLTGAMVGCILILVKKYGLKSKIAFGPFLVIALFLTMFLRL
jgi:leader peptidase (prepilin peptidase) / N-methyltransferase